MNEGKNKTSFFLRKSPYTLSKSLKKAILTILYYSLAHIAQEFHLMHRIRR